MAEFPLISRPPGSVALPDNDQWTHRFEVKSETSDRIYIISQHMPRTCPTRPMGIVPVLFRVDFDGNATEVNAVFPTLPGSTRDPELMTCYAHVGQHSSCSLDWFELTKAARPYQYADLKAELERLGYQLEVCSRITKEHRKQFRANQTK
jgi:hypothetical protein